MEKLCKKGGVNIFKSKKINILIFTLLIIIGIMITFLLLNTRDAKTDEIFLTVEERLWLDEHKDEIKIGYTIDYPPVEFLNNGKYAGISADYFNLLEQKLGIKINMVEFDNFDELISQTQSRQLTCSTYAIHL